MTFLLSNQVHMARTRAAHRNIFIYWTKQTPHSLQIPSAVQSNQTRYVITCTPPTANHRPPTTNVGIDLLPDASLLLRPLCPAHHAFSPKRHIFSARKSPRAEHLPLPKSNKVLALSSRVIFPFFFFFVLDRRLGAETSKLGGPAFKCRPRSISNFIRLPTESPNPKAARAFLPASFPSVSRSP